MDPIHVLAPPRPTREPADGEKTFARQGVANALQRCQLFSALANRRGHGQWARVSRAHITPANGERWINASHRHGLRSAQTTKLQYTQRVHCTSRYTGRKRAGVAQGKSVPALVSATSRGAALGTPARTTKMLRTAAQPVLRLRVLKADA